MMLRRVVRTACAQRSAALLLRGSTNGCVNTMLLNQPLVCSNLNHVVTAPFAAGASTTRCWMSTSVKVPPPPTSNHKHTPLPGAQGSIIYTETDEAPALATYSLYPVIAKVCSLLLNCWRYFDSLVPIEERVGKKKMPNESAAEVSALSFLRVFFGHLLLSVITWGGVKYLKRMSAHVCLTFVLFNFLMPLQNERTNTSKN
jgi:hypothetical protein